MYEVSWTTHAMETLRNIIESAPSDLSEAIIDAAHRMQACLVEDGPTAGESRIENFRVVFALPLITYIWVDPSEFIDTVTVVRILYRGKRSGKGMR